MRYPAVFLLLFSFIIQASMTLAFADEEDGFRGIKWGDNISQNQTEMILKETDKSNKYYSRKKDKMQLGETTLTSILYNYYKGRLATIIITTKGSSNKRLLIEAFKAKFYQPEQPNRYIEEYIWSYPTAFIVVKCNSITDSCNAYLRSTEMASIEKRDDLEAAENAKKDF